MELETMPKSAPEQKHELGHQARIHPPPGAETDLDASRADTDRERSASKESGLRDDRGFVVVLWLLALLIAEVELWAWVFAHMYRP
jgi:hypothetical protein